MKVEDFPAFFEALHGYPPFPWQTELCRRVADHGWGDVEQRTRLLSLPTSAGKTAVIDVAVFNLALEANSGAERRAPLRIFFVVDRRIVVDDAYERACKIAQALAKAASDGHGGILAETEMKLRKLAGEACDSALHVSIMRGGTGRDDTWARSPAQPTVCVSTIDQVGSRLLFRGYGLSEAARPIHAGLVGHDSLVILDEAHISRPFLQTLRAVGVFAGDRWAEAPLTRVPLVVEMTATPEENVKPFSIDLGTEKDSEHPVFKQRWEASKRAKLVELKDGDATSLARHMAQEALMFAGLNAPPSEDTPPSRSATKRGKSRAAATHTPAPTAAQVIGVVVNRVATARSIFQSLQERKGDCHVLLLTGRIRPFDRDELLQRKEVDGRPGGWLRYLRPDRGQGDVLTKPLIVVATQTIEVGADLSFDALVTEAASLDALRQRFGRLDRLGRRQMSAATIVATKDALAKNAQDPVYGLAIGPTWQWLKKIGGKSRVADFGLSAIQPHLDILSHDERQAMTAPPTDAPVMLPAHVDTWCQTDPTPMPDPDVASFLHGPQPTPPDVYIIWRADLPENMAPREQVIDVVSLVPPSSMEALPMPLFRVRDWLRKIPARGSNGQPQPALADIEGTVEAEEPIRGGRDVDYLPALRWRGGDDKGTGLVAPDELRPGDTIIVPAAYGGCDEFGWDPNSPGIVSDVADACALLARWRPTIRLHKAVIGSWRQSSGADGEKPLGEAVAALLIEAGAADDPLDTLDAALDEIARRDGVPTWVKTAAELLIRRKGRTTAPYPAGLSGWMLRQRPLSRSKMQGVLQRLRGMPDANPSPEPESEGGGGNDGSSFTIPFALDKHCRGVRDLTDAWAVAIGLPADMRDDLDLAASLHDIGKADPRFQIMLHGGDEVAAACGNLLAKSGLDAADRRAWRLASLRSALPAHFRHEALSVQLLQANPRLWRAHDPDLILHLITTHHGHGRPFMPVCIDDATPAVSVPHAGGIFSLTTDRRRDAVPLHRIDSGCIDRFWRLTRKYGYWGLAYLESILRLADHAESRREVDAAPQPQPEGQP